VIVEKKDVHDCSGYKVKVVHFEAPGHWLAYVVRPALRLGRPESAEWVTISCALCSE
jgi:hypothetical protein